MNKDTDTCAWADIENKSVAFSTLHLRASNRVFVLDSRGCGCGCSRCPSGSIIDGRSARHEVWMGHLFPISLLSLIVLAFDSENKKIKRRKEVKSGHICE